MATRSWWREQFWLVPMTCAAVAAALGIVLTVWDQQRAETLQRLVLFDGGPEGARALLSAIITSMISFTGLVFSITIVVLQLTSGQFSPRVLRTFLQDRLNQFTLGVFVATFVYAMLVLRAVRGTAEIEPFVPQISVTVSFVFVAASVLIFLIYISHIAQSIRVATIIETIGNDTREALEQREARHGEQLPLSQPQPADLTDGRLVLADRPGVVQMVREDDLVSEGERSGATIWLLRAAGEFIPAGAPLFAVTDGVDVREEALLKAVVLDKERSLDQDLGFGMRQLVDIAERALSPGVNDPTTAIQVVDQLHDLLRRLATRPLTDRQLHTPDGRLALVVPQPRYEDYLQLAVDEIARWGADARRVQLRLRAMLRDLYSIALPEHRPAIAEQLARWHEQPSDTFPDLTPSDVGLR